MKTWKHFKTLEGHSGIVETIEHSLCGQYIASGGRDRTIRIWCI